MTETTGESRAKETKTVGVDGETDLTQGFA
jgi:hypothetical protein